MTLLRNCHAVAQTHLTQKARGLGLQAALITVIWMAFAAASVHALAYLAQPFLAHGHDTFEEAGVIEDTLAIVNDVRLPWCTPVASCRWA